MNFDMPADRLTFVGSLLGDGNGNAIASIHADRIIGAGRLLSIGDKCSMPANVSVHHVYAHNLAPCFIDSYTYDDGYYAGATGHAAESVSKHSYGRDAKLRHQSGTIGL